MGTCNFIMLGLLVVVLEWLCQRIGNEIQVSKVIGAYKLIEEPYCHICSQPDVTTKNCSMHKHLYGFDRIYVMGKYLKTEDDLLSAHILKLKEDKQYAEPLGKALTLTVIDFYPELLRADVLVPVPLHIEEFSKRGFNQSLELAKIVGDILNIEVVFAIKKLKPVNMRELGWKKRREVVKGLYQIIGYQKNKISSKHVVLIDDVVTSGFTVSECSEVLKQAGARRVDVLALARTAL